VFENSLHRSERPTLQATALQFGQHSPLCRPNCALHPTNWDIQPGTSNFQTRSRADGIALEKQPGTTAERSYAKDPVYEGSCVVYEAA